MICNQEGQAPRYIVVFRSLGGVLVKRYLQPQSQIVELRSFAFRNHPRGVPGRKGLARISNHEVCNSSRDRRPGRIDTEQLDD